MKANESIEKYPARVREYANYTVKSVKNVCKTCGPRIVGSESDAKAREYFKADLDKFCDETKVEPLKVSDKAFMSWVPIGASMLILSAIAFMLGFAAVTLALTVLTLFFIVAEFIFYKPVLDIFFPKKDTANVIGIRKAAGETKRRIILSGHTDSAFEWTYTYYGGRPAVLTVIISAVLGLVLSIGSAIYSIVNGRAISFSIAFSGDNTVVKVLCIVMLVLIPFYIAALFFCNYKRPVTGANDDLTGCFISCAVAKFLSDNDIRFENTEVQVLLAAGEEAGLRGAKAYGKAHAAEIKESGIETIFVGFDTIRDFDFKTIYEKDMTGVVKNDSRVCNLVKEGAINAGFEDVAIKTIDLGSTDAAAMSQAGIPAAAFCAMDPSPARYYHTRLDTEENLDLKTIEAGVKIALETTFLFDEKGIN